MIANSRKATSIQVYFCIWHALNLVRVIRTDEELIIARLVRSTFVVGEIKLALNGRNIHYQTL